MTDKYLISCMKFSIIFIKMFNIDYFTSKSPIHEID